jgi:hypothetical protein
MEERKAQRLRQPPFSLPDLRLFLALDWLPKVLTQKGNFLGFEFCSSRGSFATVPAMESRFLRCSSVADIHLSTLRSD